MSGPGSHGNENLARIATSQYLTVDGTSDTVTLPVGTIAVTLYAAQACWIVIGNPGEDPTAAAPGAEKTSARGFMLPATTEWDAFVPQNTDGSLVKIAAIQISSGGRLDVSHRNF